MSKKSRRTRDLVVATGNPGKLAEVKFILRGLPVNLISLAELPGHPRVAEDGETFEANAEKKSSSSWSRRLPSFLGPKRSTARRLCW